METIVQNQSPLSHTIEHTIGPAISCKTHFLDSKVRGAIYIMPSLDIESATCR
ncbi:hypothetical protein SAMN03159422_03594 [Agrobacterium fabrum]|uniref:hypothetical protein n=1 Tax=Agrobacterium tumefaciens TaxID=358 RepID=UPI00089241FE|nr:hypothetical protein [Agrobacterium tumefaciens]SDB69784.1 hypothetical protein SAMN03159422_03594 [Agrobacterium fabrum]SER66869.1 hypothetical protein SAMN03159504_03378 [Agrobacterium fabrum]